MFNPNLTLQVLLGRAIETSDQSERLRPVREAAIRFAAEIMRLDSRGGEQLERSIEQIQLAMFFAESHVVRAPNVVDQMREREEIFETIATAQNDDGEPVLYPKSLQALAALLGLELEMPDDESAEGDGELAGSQSGGSGGT